MGNIGPWQLLIVLAIVLLLFGAKRLPQAARGLGQSLRIFKAETSGLLSDDNEAAAESAESESTAAADQPAVDSKPAAPVHNPVSEGVTDQQRDT